MANESIKNAFSRFWEHTLSKINDVNEKVDELNIPEITTVEITGDMDTQNFSSNLTYNEIVNAYQDGNIIQALALEEALFPLGSPIISGEPIIFYGLIGNLNLIIMINLDNSININETQLEIAPTIVTIDDAGNSSHTYEEIVEIIDNTGSLNSVILNYNNISLNLTGIIENQDLIFSSNILIDNNDKGIVQCIFAPTNEFQMSTFMFDADSIGADPAGSADEALAEAKRYTDTAISNIPENDLNGYATEEYVNTAVGTKLSTSLKGAANGLAELDTNGKVPSAQLPSYVDDVIEGTLSTFGTGETGKIYLDTTTNKTYRWSGSTFVEISESLALGETSSTAFRGDYGAAAYAHSQIFSGNPHGTSKEDLGLGNVENKSSETIRSELTKDNVTTALGYTPPTQDTIYEDATTSTSGLMSSSDKTKLNNITEGAEVNQNAFSNIKIGSTTVAADAKTDTVEFVGNNVTITPDATNDKITFSVADGSTSTKGIVQLTDSISSSSTTTAATPNSVKSVYDLANTKPGLIVTDAITGNVGEIFNYTKNKATGNYSHAEGSITMASGDSSHAEGLGTIAIGIASHAEGALTTASGGSSHAEGSKTIASGNYSHAEGQGVSRILNETLTGSANATTYTVSTWNNDNFEIGNILKYNNIYAMIVAIDETNLTITLDKTLSSTEALNNIAIVIQRGIAYNTSSHIEGEETTASGQNAHAEGSNTIASGNCSHAEGYYPQAKGNYSHAEGFGSLAIGNSSHAEGDGTTANGNKSHAEGNHTIAFGDYSHAEGEETIASGQSSHAEGYRTEAIGTYSHAEGTGTMASDTSSHAEGQGTTASGLASHAEGLGTEASGQASHAEGDNTIASKSGSHAEGIGTIASSYYSHVQGQYNINDSNNKYAHIVGNGTSDTERSNAHTLDWDGNAWFAGNITLGENKKEVSTVGLDQSGKQIYINGEYITAKTGAEIFNNYSYNKAAGSYSHAEGHNTTASGDYSHAENFQTKATGNYSHAEGRNTTASGLASHAEGYGTNMAVTNLTITGEANATTYTTSLWNNDNLKIGKILQYNNVYAKITAIDKTNLTITLDKTLSTEALDAVKPTFLSGIAIGNYSHTEGSKTIASGNYSHAEGSDTIASGQSSHAEGATTIASGSNSHAEGYRTEATGAYSHAEGTGTIASGYNQHVQGKYNIIANNYIHIVGNGTSDTERSNAHTLDQNGNAWFAGNITLGENKKEVASKEDIPDISNFASKEDIPDVSNFASKEDIPDVSNFASKNELIGKIGTGTNAEIFNDLNQNKATGNYSHAEGRSTTASGNQSHTEGQDTTASEQASHAEGYGAKALGLYSHAEGYDTTASGQASHAEGENTTASGNSSHAEGMITTASGQASHAEGVGTIASGTDSHAEGLSTIAFGFNSHAEGQGSISTPPINITGEANANTYTVSTWYEGYCAVGQILYCNNIYARITSINETNLTITLDRTLSSTEALNNEPISYFKNGIAYGDNSHTEGYNTIASEIYSHAEGDTTIACGWASHAEGGNTIASGTKSHAEGNNTIASGSYSHAEGMNTIVSGDFSHAEGEGTIASSRKQHVQGKYNIEDAFNSYAHIVGNGNSDNERSNAYTLDWDGRAWFAGDIYVGSTSGKEEDEGSKKLATEDFVRELIGAIENGTY